MVPSESVWFSSLNRDSAFCLQAFVNIIPIWVSYLEFPSRFSVLDLTLLNFDVDFEIIGFQSSEVKKGSSGLISKVCISLFWSSFASVILFKSSLL